jgi:phage baseplate assembly protein W
MATFIGFSTHNKKTGTAVLEDKSLAIRDLSNHFYTRRGERLGSPEFGSILPELVFDQYTQATEDAADDDIREIIGLDPRWTLMEYNLDFSDHQLTVTITLRYNTQATIEELVLKYRSKEEI